MKKLRNTEAELKKRLAYKKLWRVIKCGTYPYVPGRDRMNNSQVSYFVSTWLILY